MKVRKVFSHRIQIGWIARLDTEFVPDDSHCTHKSA